MNWNFLFNLIFAIVGSAFVLLALSYMPEAWRSGDGYALIGILTFFMMAAWQPFFSAGWRGPLVLSALGVVSTVCLIVQSTNVGLMLLALVVLLNTALCITWVWKSVRLRAPEASMA